MKEHEAAYKPPERHEKPRRVLAPSILQLGENSKARQLQTAAALITGQMPREASNVNGQETMCCKRTPEVQTTTMGRKKRACVNATSAESLLRSAKMSSSTRFFNSSVAIFVPCVLVTRVFPQFLACARAPSRGDSIQGSGDGNDCSAHLPLGVHPCAELVRLR